MSINLEEHESTAVTAIKLAGNILLKYFKKIEKSDITKKSKDDFVTIADKEAEKKIISVLKGHYNYDILSEEAGFVDGPDKDYKWIIDPLDGTNNYAFSVPLYGVSIALEHKGEIILGVINLPSFDYLLTARKGHGAFFNKNKIKVSEQSKLEDCFLFFDSDFERAERTRTDFKKIEKNVLKYRILGSAVLNLAFVAMGAGDIAIEYGNYSWDVAASYLIVEEAGGKVTRLNGTNGKDGAGKGLHYDHGAILITNGKVHDEVLKLLNEK